MRAIQICMVLKNLVDAENALLEDIANLIEAALDAMRNPQPSTANKFATTISDF